MSDCQMDQILIFFNFSLNTGLNLVQIGNSFNLYLNTGLNFVQIGKSLNGLSLSFISLTKCLKSCVYILGVWYLDGVLYLDGSRSVLVLIQACVIDIVLI